MKINVGTLCSGYDSQCMALDELKKIHPDFDYDLVFWSEIDKYACQVHSAVFPQWADRNVGDMTKVDWSQFDGTQIDLLTYSTPCTDISNAGQQKGLEEGSGTRSSILWYTRYCIQQLKPKYLMLENVKALVSKKFLPFFNKWLKELDDMGYDSDWQVCNATDYGIETGVAQNRERVFVISTRRDSDWERKYTFPQKVPLTKTIEDYLEDDVDEKYYLKDEQVNKFLDLIQAGDGKETEEHHRDD